MQLTPAPSESKEESKGEEEHSEVDTVPPIPDHPEPSHVEDIQKIKSGTQHVVSFSGYSQYTAGSGGASACGLAAFNCARIILQREAPSEDAFAVVRSMLERDIMEEILYICTRWNGEDHLDPEDIHQSPLFSNALVSQGSDYRSPSFDEFKEVLSQLKAISPKTTAAIITRPPEIVAILKIAIEPEDDIFIVFDSHPRALHPDGAGFIFNSTLEGAANYLQNLFQFDQGLLDDPSLQWQAQMLSNFSAMFFTANPNSKDTMNQQDAVMMSSLAVLTLKAEVARLTSNNSVLHAENEQLQGQVDTMELEMDRLKHTIHKLKEASAKLDKGKGRDHRPNRTSHGGNAWQEIPKISNKHPGGSTVQGYPLLYGSYSHNDTSRHVNNYAPFASGGRRLDDTSDSTRRIGRADQSIPPGGSNGTSFSASLEDEDENMAYAQRLQAEFAEEDRLLALQRQNLQKHVQKTFECKICMDEHLEDVVCRLDVCNHAFCRDSLRGYASSRIQERSVPILCPVCTTEKDVARPGVVDARVVEMLGISPEDYARFTELELAAFSILVHCRQCGGGAFVDKSEYDIVKVVPCPLPGCHHAWCKACSRTIDFTGPPHSCDGTSELNHLMAQQGWKHCPGCKTPTEKTGGCNHMTCMSPGCHTHFCYTCGASIVKSIIQQEIRSSVGHHYRGKCTLFYVPPDVGAGGAAPGPGVPRPGVPRQAGQRRRP